jgi:hypothetical protein
MYGPSARVPEPGSLPLLLTAGLIAGWVLRRANRA